MRDPKKPFDDYEAQQEEHNRLDLTAFAVIGLCLVLALIFV